MSLQSKVKASESTFHVKNFSVCLTATPKHTQCIYCGVLEKETCEDDFLKSVAFFKRWF